MALYVETAEVGKLYIERRLCRPASFVGEFLQTKLVGPHLNALHGAPVVANTDHDGLHLAERRITHHADAVAGMVAVEVAELLVVAGGAEALLVVAVLLHCRELVEVDVDHVLLWPHCTTVAGVVGVVARINLFGRQCQRHFVFVVVALVVRS